MALRKRGVTFSICFRKIGVPRKEEGSILGENYELLERAGTET